MKRSATLLCIAAMLCAGAMAQADQIISVGVPQGSQDAHCHPFDDQVWFVDTTPNVPLDIETGIGFLLNPDIVLEPEDFGLHEHEYIAAWEPDPGVALVTFGFDVPVLVKQVDVIQHRNGLTQIEGFVGDSPGSMVSIGSVFGPYGDVTGTNLFLEGEVYPFAFDNSTEGKFFRVVARKTSLTDGYAAYRAFPCDGLGTHFSTIPEPSAVILIGVGAGWLLWRRRR